MVFIQSVASRIFQMLNKGLVDVGSENAVRICKEGGVVFCN